MSDHKAKRWSPLSVLGLNTTFFVSRIIYVMLTAVTMIYKHLMDGDSGSTFGLIRIIVDAIPTCSGCGGTMSGEPI